MKYIRRATSQDKKPINELRVTEFRRSKDFFLLQPERLLWNHCDDENIVLAAWNDKGQAVSTMRAVAVNDRTEGDDCLECSVPPVNFPAIVFNSAATHKTYRGQGLNQAIRYHFLLAAVRGRIQTIISPIYAGAPRAEFMKTLGYEFVVPERCWQNKLQPNSQRLLGILMRSKMKQAIHILEQTRQQIIHAYPFQGDALDFNLILR